ncbi:MAG: hypothetical protein LBM96_06080 [Methanobrevibacter sp.]|nr:hypothetical protein [Candidatus Methanoflexus mossambicus]
MIVRNIDPTNRISPIIRIKMLFDTFFLVPNISNLLFKYIANQYTMANMPIMIKNAFISFLVLN